MLWVWAVAGALRSSHSVVILTDPAGDFGVRLLKYFLIFNAVYFLAQIVITIIGVIIGVETGSGASIGAILAGAIVSGRSFVLNHQRLPNTAEKWRLVLGSLAVSLGISVLFLLVLLAVMPDLGELITAMIAELSIVLFAVIFGVVLLVHIAAMYFSFGFLLSRVMKDYGPEVREPVVRREPRL